MKRRQWRMKNYRVVWTEPKVVKIEEWEVPEISGRQVLVKTHFSLISPGTKRAWLLHLPNTPATFPQYPGYCAVGEVLGVGEQVRRFKKGDRVAWSGRHSAHAVINEEVFTARSFRPPRRRSGFLGCHRIARFLSAWCPHRLVLSLPFTQWS